MSCSRCRAWVGLKRAGALLAGTGLAVLIGAWTGDAASARTAGQGRGEGVAFSRPTGTPVMAIVSLNQQRVTVYDADGPMLQAPVSTGKTGYETPAGIFTVLEKKAEHYSNLYDDAAMPFMQRLTWSGIALHAGMLPGYPASHGCVRMPLGFAERFFERSKLGMRVLVVRDDISPVEVVHPVLFKPSAAGADTVAPRPAPTGLGGADKAPTPVADVSVTGGTPSPGPRPSLRALAVAKSAVAANAAKKAEEVRRAARWATLEAGQAGKALRRAEGIARKAELRLQQASQLAGAAGGTTEAMERLQRAKTAAETAHAEAQAQLERIRAELQPKIDLALQLREQAKIAETASVAAQEEAKEAARKLAPISVFVSRATQRVYVRQAREPLFDSPIAIADAERPLGTYVFTALAYTDGEVDLRWSVVSMYRSRNGPETDRGKRHEGIRNTGAAPADLAGAKLALDRITIPQEAVDRISEVIGPGSSLIVSDEALSRETGKATEFIVVMSGEPQGGMRIRRRVPEVRYRYQRPYESSPFGWSSRPFWSW